MANKIRKSKDNLFWFIMGIGGTLIIIALGIHFTGLSFICGGG